MPHLPKDESLSAQGPLQYTSALHHINVLMFGGTKYQNISKFECWRSPAVIAPRTGSLDEVWMLLHQVHRDLRECMNNEGFMMIRDIERTRMEGKGKQ
jgi:hypothetical protein